MPPASSSGVAVPVWLLLLPPEVLKLVWTYVDDDDLWPMSGTCRALRAVVQDLRQDWYNPRTRMFEGKRQRSEWPVGGDEVWMTHLRSAVTSVAKVRWALANGCTSKYLVLHAAAEDALDVVKFLFRTVPVEWAGEGDGQYLSVWLPIHFVENGNLEALKWLRERQEKGDWVCTWHGVAATAQEFEEDDIVAWCKEKGMSLLRLDD